MTARTALLRELIADFEVDVAGCRSGLTRAEVRRAWRARHGDEMPARSFGRLSEDLLIKPLPRRTCAITGQRHHAWVIA